MQIRKSIGWVEELEKGAQSSNQTQTGWRVELRFQMPTAPSSKFFVQYPNYIILHIGNTVSNSYLWSIVLEVSQCAHRQVHILEINCTAEIYSLVFEGTTYLIFNYII